MVGLPELEEAPAVPRAPEGRGPAAGGLSCWGLTFVCPCVAWTGPALVRPTDVSESSPLGVGPTLTGSSAFGLFHFVRQT
jgi:hypothetical protein